MKVILLSDVPKLGKKFDIKDVADGYGRNYLVKNKLAELATEKTVKKADEMKNLAEKALLEREAETTKKLAGVSLSLSAKANEEGHLFAAVKKEDVLSMLKEKGVDLKSDEVVLEKPVKQVGEVLIPVKIGKNEIKIKLDITAVKE